MLCNFQIKARQTQVKHIFTVAIAIKKCLNTVQADDAAPSTTTAAAVAAKDSQKMRRVYRFFSRHGA
jgi:hypothetical protein